MISTRLTETFVQLPKLMSYSMSESAAHQFLPLEKLWASSICFQLEHGLAWSHHRLFTNRIKTSRIILCDSMAMLCITNRKHVKFNHLKFYAMLLFSFMRTNANEIKRLIFSTFWNPKKGLWMDNVYTCNSKLHRLFFLLLYIN